MSLPEILVISVVAILLVVGAMVVWRRDPERNTADHGAVTTTLAHIERAKARYAADNRLPDGTWLTLSTLRKAGYLTPSEAFPPDVHFVPNRVGENTTYHFADGSHTDHPAPVR